MLPNVTHSSFLLNDIYFPKYAPWNAYLSWFCCSCVRKKKVVCCQIRFQRCEIKQANRLLYCRTSHNLKNAKLLVSPLSLLFDLKVFLSHLTTSLTQFHTTTLFWTEYVFCFKNQIHFSSQPVDSQSTSSEKYMLLLFHYLYFLKMIPRPRVLSSMSYI